MAASWLEEENPVQVRPGTDVLWLQLPFKGFSQPDPLPVPTTEPGNRRVQAHFYWNSGMFVDVKLKTSRGKERRCWWKMRSGLSTDPGGTPPGKEPC